MQKLSIAIDGLNLGLRQGTGIATYSRELATMLVADGHAVNLIYGLRRVSNGATRSSEFLQRLALEGELSGRRLPRSELALWSARYAAHYVLRRPVSVAEVKIPKDAALCSPERLPPAGTRVFNGNLLLRCAQAYTSFLPLPLKIKLPVKADILHLTSPVPITAPGAKQICTIHDVIPFVLADSTNVDLRYYNRMLRATLAATDLVFAVSQRTKRDLMEYYRVPEDKIHVTYQAVDVPAHFRDASDEDVERFVRGNLELTPKKYLLYFGAIEPKKNLPRLLEAVKGAKISMPLVVVGPYAWGYDDAKRAIKSLEQRRFDDGRPRLIRVPYLTRERLVQVIRGARCALFPSLYEGFGLPALEAMQFGCPVLASKLGSLPEICGDAALYADAYDVRALQSAIEHIVQDDALVGTLKEKGLKQVQNFSMSQYKARVLDGYAKVLGSTR